MTPEQSLELVDNLIAQIAMNRTQHVQAMTAVETLRNAIAQAARKPQPARNFRDDSEVTQ